MRPLSGSDSLFLSLETPSRHQHVGGLTILDPGSRSVTFEDVVRTLRSRIAYAPKFRWKLKQMPAGLDVPAWVDDDDFDVRRHVRHVGVPAPGGFRETALVAGSIMSSQLDRNLPLWELWYMDGLSGGQIALLLKYHHCLLDGMAGASLATALMDIEPDATRPLVEPPPPELQTAGSAPESAEVLRHLAACTARRQFALPRYIVNTALKLLSGAVALARDEQHRQVLRAPRTSFNKSIGPQRSLSFASVSLDDLKALRVLHGVQINDLVLTLVAGALRDYLLNESALPDSPLIAGVPVSTRAADDATHDNQLTAMFVAMATNISDPVKRLQAIHASAQSAKALQKAMGARRTQPLGEVAPPLVLSTAIRALYGSGLISHGPTIVNTTVSNVPGPPVPLFMCGARVTGIYPCSIILEGVGINCTVISYMDRVDFTFTVDPLLIPDPWTVSEGVRTSLADLKDASGLGTVTEVGNGFRHSPEPWDSA